MVKVVKVFILSVLLIHTTLIRHVKASSPSQRNPTLTSPLSRASIFARQNDGDNDGKVEVRGGQDLVGNSVRWTLGGLILAFNSGYMNGCCLSGLVSADGAKQAVAAVTGTYTTSAMHVASKKFSQARSPLSILLSYMLGSVVSGLLNPSPLLFDITPECGYTLLVGTIALFVATRAPSDMITFCLVAFANGLQNSLSSTHSSNLLRTAHYSGMSSDIGTFTGQVMRGNKKNLDRLQIFLALSACFWTGGFIAFYAASRFQKSSLLVPCLVDFVLSIGLIQWTQGITRTAQHEK